jgi:L-threonylcarbamoyladenylate synthase
MQRLPARKPDGTVAPEAVTAAVAALRAGELVILPTDTVYGLAADALNATAVARLFQAKARPPEKGIALLAASPAQAAALADLTAPAAQRLMARWWPGPLTLVARALVTLPAGIGTDKTVGVRVPADEVPRAIAAALGRPLAVTSANRSGDAAVATFGEAINTLVEWVALALDGGDCPLGVASTVVDCTGPQLRVLRQGSAAVMC